MYLGIDIGGTYAKIGLIDEDDKIISYDEILVNRDNYSIPIIELVKSGTQEFIIKNNIKDIKSCGVSATGQIQRDTGIVIGAAGHIPSWQGTNIKKEIENLLNVPTTVINDGNAMILGEMYNGSVCGYEDIVGITIGTGIGGGIISNSQLIQGSLGIAGEVGHIITNFSNMDSKYNRRDSFEGKASTVALVEAVEKLGYKNINGKIIFDELIEKEEVYKVVDDWLNQIVVGLASLIHVFNPQIVVIGGGVSVREKEVISPIRKKLNSFILPSFSEKLKIVSATLGNKAGLFGAVGYAKQKYNK